ncbi:PPE domain-containing protein [Nocardia callitridis]|uniref:PPE domain-containing protein n=1 Tax=Nocardia callitridis TaxID=648753 RepID=A0ABP9JT07_9NOCA
MRQYDDGAITNPENAHSFSFTEIARAADQMNPADLTGALQTWSTIATTVSDAGSRFADAVGRVMEQHWEGVAADSAASGVRDYAARLGEFAEALGAQAAPLSAAAAAATKFKAAIPNVGESSDNSSGSRNSREEQARDDMITHYIQPYGQVAQGIPLLPPPLGGGEQTTVAGVTGGRRTEDGASNGLRGARGSGSDTDGSDTQGALLGSRAGAAADGSSDTEGHGSQRVRGSAGSGDRDAQDTATGSSSTGSKDSSREGSGSEKTTEHTGSNSHGDRESRDSESGSDKALGGKGSESHGDDEATDEASGGESSTRGTDAGAANTDDDRFTAHTDGSESGDDRLDAAPGSTKDAMRGDANDVPGATNTTAAGAAPQQVSALSGPFAPAAAPGAAPGFVPGAGFAAPTSMPPVGAPSWSAPAEGIGVPGGASTLGAAPPVGGPGQSVEPQPGTSRSVPPGSAASTQGNAPNSTPLRPNTTGPAGYSGAVAPSIPLNTADEKRKGPKFLRTEEHARELLGEVEPTVPPVIGAE